MVYPVEHYYLTFGGTLCQDEIWQCGMHFAPSSGEDIFEGAFDNISLSDIFDDLASWVTNYNPVPGPGSGFSSLSKLEWCRLAVKDESGLDKFESRIHTAAAPVASGALTTHAPQIAYVVTLWSGKTVRRANWGRFYVPTPVVDTNYANGRLGQSWCDSVAAAARSVMIAINGEISTVGIATYPAIISKVGVGEVNPIAQIGVGRVLDTQQRRRRKLDEAIVYTAF